MLLTLFCTCLSSLNIYASLKLTIILGQRRASLIAQLIENLPGVQETPVRFLGWEGPLEKGKATHSSVLPGEFYGLYRPWGHKESNMTEWLSHFTWTEEPGRLQSMWSQIDMTEHTHFMWLKHYVFYLHFAYINYVFIFNLSVYAMLSTVFVHLTWLTKIFEWVNSENIAVINYCFIINQS